MVIKVLAKPIKLMRMSISMKNNAKSKPIYLQAKDDILNLIISGNYKVGDLMPSVREMARLLNYTNICIQNAVKLLTEEGTIESLPRKGCHVKKLPSHDLSPEVLNPDNNKMLKTEPTIPGTKKIRVGVFSEMSDLGSSWKEIFLRYMSRNLGIYIELIDVNNMSEYQVSNEIDILQISSERLAYFADQGLLFDIEGNNEKLDINREDFFPGYIKACYHNNKIWGTPSSAGINCFFYNSSYSDLLKPLEKDMQMMEYLETCKKISQNLPSGIPLQRNLPTSFIFNLLTEGINMTPEEVFVKGNVKKLKERLNDLVPYLRDSRIFHQLSLIENCQESRIQDVISGQIVLMQGTSAWLYTCDFQKNFTWGILPLPQVSQGHGALFMHVISNNTLFPVECIEILNYLASFEVQSFFAEKGHFIAHRQAIKKLKIQDFDNESLRQITMAMNNTEVFEAPDSYYYEYINLIFLAELFLWQNGTYDTEQFLVNLQKKTRYYYRAKRIEDEKRNKMSGTSAL